MVGISSPSTVEECFGKNDVIFADRPQLECWKELTYDFTTIGAAPYGPLRRSLRCISAIEIFSTSRMNSFLGIRLEEVRSLVKNLHQAVTERGGVSRVDMRPMLQGLSSNVIMRMVSRKRYFGAGIDDLEDAKKFMEIISDALELRGASDPADFVPVLRWFGLGKQQRGLRQGGGQMCSCRD